jgi:hypothetical protein
MVEVLLGPDLVDVRQDLLVRHLDSLKNAVSFNVPSKRPSADEPLSPTM